MQGVEAVVLLALPIIAFCVVADYFFNHSFKVIESIGPIKKEKVSQHPTREGFQGAKSRFYIVAGGSGFIGSWVVRYLLLRGEKNVSILDRRRPPVDVIRHGAIWHDIELTSVPAVEAEFKNIASRCHTSSKIIIYNCSCIRRYFSMSNQDLGLQAAEVLAINIKHFITRNVVLIHIGDSMSHRIPVSFWKIWDRKHWSQHSRNDLSYIVPWASKDKSDAFSPYAWYQGAIESLVRSLPMTTGCLRPEGFVTGHAGDSFLTPALQYNGALLHNWGVPISVINVEDVVRAALALEYALLDPKTTEAVSGSVYSVEGHGVTTLKHIYDYIAEQRKFRVIKVTPIVVYLASWAVSVCRLFMKTPSLIRRNLINESLLCGTPTTLTLERFSTLQIAQIPNSLNKKRTQEVLKFKPNFSLSQTLDSVIREVEILTKREKKVHGDLAG